jgi:hypothetical protein
MNTITPFLWSNDNAEDVAEFYLSIFPQAKKLVELGSSEVVSWPGGKIATIPLLLFRGVRSPECIRACTGRRPLKQLWSTPERCLGFRNERMPARIPGRRSRRPDD